MHAKHVLYMRTLLRILQARIENTNPLIMNLSSLLRKDLSSFMRLSIVMCFQFGSRVVGRRVVGSKRDATQGGLLNKRDRA